ncbi:MAG: DUF362 domain-containing protein [Fibrobacterota bacterium]
MAATVFFAPLPDTPPADKVERRLKDLLTAAEFEKHLPEKDYVAVKTHFGEGNSVTHVPPRFFKPLSARIRQAGAIPFLTETSTLYKGRRGDAVAHMLLAHEHGYTVDATEMPVIMADGLKGDYEYEVEITPGYTVAVAGMLRKINALVCVSHPTGHIALGFGGTIKNLGMGLSSRKGKLVQHSSVKPQVNRDKCTGCGRCVKWCPSDCITMTDKKARINWDACIGCGECLVECRFDAILYNWEMDKTRIQELTADHAYGVVKGRQCFYINYALNFTKDCDCFGTVKTPVVSDLGLFASTDPVAIDEACITIIEERNKKPLSDLTYPGLDPRIQTRRGQALGMGTREYRLVEC